MFAVFDIVILAIIALSSLIGLYRGFTKIVISLVGFIASIAFAIFIYPYVKNLFSEYIANEMIVSVVAGVTSYIISLIIFTFLVSKIILLFCDLSGGVIDRSLGLVAGFIKGLLFSLVIFSVIAILSTGSYKEAEFPEDLINNLSKNKYPDWLKSSITSSYLEDILKYVMGIIPEETLHRVDILPQKKDQEDDVIDAINKKNKKPKEERDSFADFIPS
jgi:membrane protein required for colicin V production